MQIKFEASLKETLKNKDIRSLAYNTLARSQVVKYAPSTKENIIQRRAAKWVYTEITFHTEERQGWWVVVCGGSLRAGIMLLYCVLNECPCPGSHTISVVFRTTRKLHATSTSYFLQTYVYICLCYYKYSFLRWPLLFGIN